MESEVVYDSPGSAELERDDSFAALYAASFPAVEQEPIDIITRSLTAGVGVVLRARTQGRTVGFATAHLVQEPPLAFMVYLAVAPEMRCHGIGSHLLENLWQACDAHSATRGVLLRAFVWEIDAPQFAATEAERARCVARHAFFRRFGGEVWLDSYLQPPLRGGDPVPMLLLGRVSAGDTPPTAEAVVRGIYFEKYGRLNGLDGALLERLVARSLGRG